ncbi:MAG: hypothetical protein AAB466_01740 [Verrucomicrobiota bacterium]
MKRPNKIFTPRLKRLASAGALAALLSFLATSCATTSGSNTGADDARQRQGITLWRRSW